MIYECSIIIPVFNQVKYTKQCLEAVAKYTQEVDYEVIIIDNGSTDGTKDFLRCLEGDVKIIKNSQNLGFSKANNQGAKVSEGNYLVFLNNDTIPQSDWLMQMILVQKKSKDVGIVGSKLLYPNGTVQHAGVVKDKGFYHIYEKFPHDHPAVNKLRSFPYVTGACMLIDKNLFFNIGMFDEHFINGFEDIDLCMKVNMLQKRVMYCPDSVVYHYANTTECRRNEHEEKLKRDMYNAKILYKKWPTQLLKNDSGYYNEDGLRSPFE